jgi:hypothetical protein
MLVREPIDGDGSKLAVVVLGLTPMEEEPTLPLVVVPAAGQVADNPDLVVPLAGQVDEDPEINSLAARRDSPSDLVMRRQMAWSTPSAALASGLRADMASKRSTAQWKCWIARCTMSGCSFGKRM